MNKENLANAIVASISGANITLESGQGSLFPNAPFFITASPPNVLSSKSNSEILKVTAKTGDVLTVVRAQKGTTTKTIATGWIIGLGIYADEVQSSVKVGTCATATGTAAKVVSTAEAYYSPVTGDIILVNYTAGQTAANATLNINGSGARAVRVRGAAATTISHSTTAGSGILYYYDGTYYQLLSNQINADSNTTYPILTTTLINAGVSTTASSINAVLSKYIIDTARTGVVKSATTDRLTVSSTAPSSPATGDVWIDTNDLPEELAPTSIVWKETPTGLVNGINTTYSASQAYISGSLILFVNGVAQGNFVTETSPGTGAFTVDVAPLTGDDLKIQYQVRTVATGNADTVDGYHANATPTANNIPVLDSNGKLPLGVDERPWARMTHTTRPTISITVAYGSQKISMNTGNTGGPTGFLTLDTTNSRITIGSGVSKIKISAVTASIGGPANGETDLIIRKNGSTDVAIQYNYKATANNLIPFSIPPKTLPVTAGDYFELFGNASVTGTYTWGMDNDVSGWLNVEVVA